MFNTYDEFRNYAFTYINRRNVDVEQNFDRLIQSGYEFLIRSFSFPTFQRIFHYQSDLESYFIPIYMLEDYISQNLGVRHKIFSIDYVYDEKGRQLGKVSFSLPIEEKGKPGNWMIQVIEVPIGVPYMWNFTLSQQSLVFDKIFKLNFLFKGDIYPASVRDAKDFWSNIYDLLIEATNYEVLTFLGEYELSQFSKQKLMEKYIIYTTKEKEKISPQTFRLKLGMIRRWF